MRSKGAFVNRAKSGSKAAQERIRRAAERAALERARLRPPAKDAPPAPRSEVEVERGWRASRHPGVRFLTLRYDRESGAGAVLIEMAPGASYPRHRHTAGEDVLVLEGELIIGEHRLGPGEYLYAPPGSVHAPRSDKGCLLFATYPGRIEHLE
jgi:anti-sigma factor ChrR (cupin superfamily)